MDCPIVVKILDFKISSWHRVLDVSGEGRFGQTGALKEGYIYVFNEFRRRLFLALLFLQRLAIPLLFRDQVPLHLCPTRRGPLNCLTTEIYFPHLVKRWKLG